MIFGNILSNSIMNKLLLILSIFTFYNAVGQESVLEGNKVKNNYDKVVLIPYMPNQHLSDADTDLSRANQMTTGDIRATIRKSLDKNIYLYLKKQYPTIALMSDTIDGDLKGIYNSINFEYATPTPLLEKKDQKITLKDKLAIQTDKVLKKEKEEVYFINGSKVKVYKNDTKYYKTVISNPNLLPFMADKFEARRFVFVNMFEIKTRYEHCLDLQNKNYEKEISVHFSIYDPNNKHLFGDVITIVYDSNSNDLRSIAEKVFPVVGEYITSKVR